MIGTTVSRYKILSKLGGGVGDDQIWLITVFGKDEAVDLTADQKRQLRAAIEAELRARAEERSRRRRR